MKWISRIFTVYMMVIGVFVYLSYALETENVPAWLMPHLPQSMTSESVVDMVVYLFAGLGLFPLVMFVGINSMVYDWDDMVRLKKFGKPVQVRILDYREAGIQINDVPALKLTLEVHDGNGVPYTVRIKQLVSLSDLHQLSNDVWYNGYAHKTKRREVVVMF